MKVIMIQDHNCVLEIVATYDKCQCISMELEIDFKDFNIFYFKILENIKKTCEYQRGRYNEYVN